MTADEINKLRAITRKNFTGAPTAAPETPAHFIESICRWLAEWCVTADQRTSVKPGCCAFVLSVDHAAGPSPDGCTELRFFKTSQSPNLAGSTYVTDYALNRVHCRPCQGADLDAVVAELNSLGYDRCPAIVFDVEPRRLFIFESGVSELGSPVTLQSGIGDPFDFPTFIELLDRIHRDDLEYPTENPKLWTDADRRIPCEEAERVIQLTVVQALKYSAHMANQRGQGWIIARESETIAGRTDLRVSVGNKCLVAAEMKVLRQFHCPSKEKLKKAPNKSKVRPIPHKTNERWAGRGANQAFRYKRHEGASEGMLLLYDMRDVDTDIASVVQKCAALAVHHRRYFLHNKLP